MKEVISIQNLIFAYEKKKILHNISCSIPSNQLTGIIGPNGCGKSTFLKNILKFYSGKYEKFLLLGKSFDSYSKKEIAKIIAYIPQKTNVIPSISIRDFICLGRFPQLVHPWNSYSKEDFQIVDNIIQTLHLDELKHKKMITLSGGELQKVFLAKALAQEAKILLLDEPTSSLDFHNAIFFMQTLKKYMQLYEITPVVVLHDLNLASLFCDNLIVMKEGKILETGSPQEIITSEKIHFIYGLECDIHYSGKNKLPYLVPHV